MIISHKYKFIFLKTTKTAGTSIEIALSKFCGSRDIITPLVSEDEEIRKNLGFRDPQNYMSRPWQYSIKDVVRFLQRGHRQQRFHHHMSARDVRELVSRKIWKTYFKFCVERNPWDRLVSLYYWMYRLKPPPTFSDFVRSEFPFRLNQKGFGIYTIDGKIAVDKICRFENLENELEEIRMQLGIPEKLVLPRAKSQFRKDLKGYREYFNVEERARIEEIFSDEINLLGYEF